MACRIVVAGRRIETRLLDISVGGASLECATDAAGGTLIAVNLPGHAGALPAVVVARESERLGVQFDVDAAASAWIKGFIARIDKAAAA